MSTRVTNAIASRKARENLVRLLFPKDVASSTSSRTGPINVSSSPSTTSLRAPQPHDTDRHNHSRHRYRKPHEQRMSHRGSHNATTGNGVGSRTRRHSYSQLRAAYLQRVHAMHPDKLAHTRHQRRNSNDNDDGNSDEGDKQQYSQENGEDRNTIHMQFIELKNAWEEYHASVRIVQRIKSGFDTTTTSNKKNNKQLNNLEGDDDDDDDYWEEEDNFTMFGVGCSFADSPAERDLRNEIMEQACRGWFPSGVLEGTTASLNFGENNNSNASSALLNDANKQEEDLNISTNNIQQTQYSNMKLSDDDMFTSCHDDDSKEENEKGPPARKFLVQPIPNRFGRGGKR